MVTAGIGDWIVDAITEHIPKLLGAVVEWFFGFLADAITWLLGAVLDVAGPPLGSADFGAALATATVMGRFVLPIFALAGILQHLRRGEAGKMVGTLLFDVPVAYLSMVLLGPVVAEASALADVLTRWALDLAPIEEGLKDIFVLAGPLMASPTTMPIPVFGVILAFVGGLVTMVAMMMRAVAIGMAVLIGPLVIATRVFPAAARMAGTWITATVALIFVKPMVAFMWAVGWIVVADPLAAGDGDPVKAATNFVTGCAVIGLGGLVPWAIFKFLPEASAAVATNLRTGLGQTVITVVGTTLAVTGAMRIAKAGRVVPPTPAPASGSPPTSSSGPSGGSSPPTASGPAVRTPVGAY